MKSLYFIRPFIFCLFLGPALACAEPAGRQTIFNDDNYQPKGAYNSLPPPKTRQPQRKPRPTPAPAKLVKINWTWNSHGFSNSKNKNRKQNNSGVFHYSLHNNRINTSTVCNNYRPGSLIYRDCRKAAKKHFNQQCSSSFPAACVAAGMTP